MSCEKLRVLKCATGKELQNLSLDIISTGYINDRVVSVFQLKRCLNLPPAECGNSRAQNSSDAVLLLFSSSFNLFCILLFLNCLIWKVGNSNIFLAERVTLPYY